MTSFSDADRFAFRGMHEAYPALRDEILAYGEESSPRGEKTTELRGVSFSIVDAVNYGVPVGCGRKVGIKMMAIDGSANLAGESYPDVSIRVAPVLARFADALPEHDDLPMSQTQDILRTAGVSVPGEAFFQGAYGPRIGDQLEAVEHQIRQDPATRQGVVSLWRAADRDPRWKDRPCTTEFQLMQRDDGLHIFVFMRANDLWTGTCYDVFQFGQVQAAMANVLQIPVGPYHHYATSLHIYERDIEKFAEVVPWAPHKRWHGGETSSVTARPAIVNPRESPGPDWRAVKPGHYFSWRHVRERFRDLLDRARDGGTFLPGNVVEDWYWEVLK